MADSVDRREFLTGTAALATSLTLAGIVPLARRAVAREASSPLFKISLAEWSLHRALHENKLNHLDFAKVSKEEFGIEAVEYVNQFFKDKAEDKTYLGQMKQRAADLGVRSQLIMIDREGKLGDPDPERRRRAVENHYKWVEAARFLGCHSIRVNAASQGPEDEQMKLAAEAGWWKDTVAPHFATDPEAARRLYERELAFYLQKQAKK